MAGQEGRNIKEISSLQARPEFYLGEPGEKVLVRLTGRIGPGGLVGTYCDCTTCACGSCSCKCSCNACGACYCDCSCSDMSLVWKADDFVNLAHVMEALNLRIGEVQRIADALVKK